MSAQKADSSAPSSGAAEHNYIASYYASSRNVHASFEELQENITCDVCIVGGGFTGLSSGLFLAEAGFSVVVLEASRIGYGASGRNGGQLVNSYSRDIDVIEKSYGADTARMLASMMFEGGRIIRERIRTYDIQCDLREGGIFAALNKRQFEGLIEHKNLWERYGNTQLELLDQQQTSDEIGTDRYTGSLLDKSGGHIHPLNMALGEAEAIRQLGGQVFEQSPAVHIDHADPAIVKTPKGQVTAKFVLVAGNAYLTGVEPALHARNMRCGTQIIATAPLSDAQRKRILTHNHCVEDCNYLLDYFRLTADNRLLYGGGVVYGARDPDNVQKLIRPKMLKTFPELANVRIDYGWTGNFLLTLSRLPQFGRLTPNIYYMQGYSGHGVTTTHLAGKVFAEALKGQAERFDAFASLPHLPMPGGRRFSVPLSAMGAVYYALRDRLGI